MWNSKGMRKIYTLTLLLVYYDVTAQSTLVAAKDAYGKRKYNTALELYQKVLSKPEKKNRCCGCGISGSQLLQEHGQV